MITTRMVMMTDTQGMVVERYRHEDWASPV